MIEKQGIINLRSNVVKRVTSLDFNDSMFNFGVSSVSSISLL